MSFWGRLFGTDEAINKTIDTVSNGLDKLWYTDEEKAEDASRDRSEARAMVVQWMAATSGQNLARRFISLMIVFVWLCQYTAAMVMSLVAVWVDNSEQWTESAKVIGNYAESMNGAMMLILGFYFAAPHMGDIARAALDRFGGKKV